MKDDDVSTIDGRSVADPGFLTALQKNLEELRTTAMTASGTCRR
jgi:hypothetical protein